MYLWKGYMLSNPMKHNLNVCSSTEGELVGANDMLGYVLWDKYFIEAQGCTVHSNLLFQDNK